jgi:hypothetical protein
LILLKSRSTRLRARQRNGLKQIGSLRLLFGGILAHAPFFTASSLIQSIEATRIAFIDEAWMMAPKEGALRDDLARYNAEGLSKQPGRIEVILICAANFSTLSAPAWRCPGSPAAARRSCQRGRSQRAMGVGVARLGVSLRPDTDTNLTGASPVAPPAGRGPLPAGAESVRLRATRARLAANLPPRPQ